MVSADTTLSGDTSLSGSEGPPQLRRAGDNCVGDRGRESGLLAVGDRLDETARFWVGMLS